MNPTVITLCFLAFAIIMFVLEKIPLGLTATIVSVGLCVTGVLEPKQAFAGYVDSNVILCVAMFVVGQALFETGMANKIGGLVTKFAKSERQLIIAIMVITGLMSGFLSNTGSAAVLIPVVVGIAAESGYSRSHLLMPLVFAAALGGNISIIGAPGNLMGVSALNELGIETSFFEYLIVGGPMMLAGILYFALFGYKLLPKNSGAASLEDDQFAVKDYHTPLYMNRPFAPVDVAPSQSTGFTPAQPGCQHQLEIGFVLHTLTFKRCNQLFDGFLVSYRALFLLSFRFVTSPCGIVSKVSLVHSRR